MSLVFWIIALFISFAIPTIVKLIWPHNVSYKEFLASCGVSILSIALIFGLMKYNSTYDTEIWNGEVTEKYSDRVSCSHSYQCNCTRTESCSGTGSSRSCSTTEICQTCYDHPYDVDWVVRANIGGTTIDRVDRQGLDEPPRWSKVVIGEPYSETFSFQNYIKASPDTLFAGSKGLVEQYKHELPNYPDINDYYRIQRVITKGVSVDNTLNLKLNEFQKKWGPQKQVNVIPIFLSEKYNQDFFKAVEAHWLGGKKNDVVIVTQLTKEGAVNWTRVMSRSENKSFDKSIEYDMAQMKVFNTDAFVKIIDENIMKRFNRENFHKYEYLLNEFSPSMLAVSLGLILSLVINIGLGYFAVKEDWFGDEMRSRY